jgi:DNA-directed RNA polymerase alpha subunit
MKHTATQVPFSQLSVRIRNALLHAGIKTPEELARFKKKDLIQLPGIGWQSATVLLALQDDHE